jgi:hypothetical protein
VRSGDRGNARRRGFQRLFLPVIGWDNPQQTVRLSVAREVMQDKEFVSATSQFRLVRQEDQASEDRWTKPYALSPSRS